MIEFGSTTHAVRKTGYGFTLLFRIQLARRIRILAGTTNEVGLHSR
jgi:hypothetical protein